MTVESRAVLSTDSIDAIDRFTGARGWARPDGKVVADELSDLFHGIMHHPIRLDQYGHDVGDASAFTATTSGGVRSLSETTCGDWTSTPPSAAATVGATEGMGIMAFNIGSTGCGSNGRFYCASVDKLVRVEPQRSAGRFAFVSSAGWTPGGGIGSADSLCADDAAVAGLPGTYRAVLATDGGSAADRFDTTGAPWVRTDGVLIAATAAAFFSANFYDSAPNVDAAGGGYLGNYARWSGATYFTTPGTSTTTCNDWTSSSSTQSAPSGRIGSTYTFQYSSTPCDASYARLVCAQQ